MRDLRNLTKDVIDRLDEATDASAIDSSLVDVPLHQDTHTVHSQATAGFSSSGAIPSPVVSDVQVAPPPSNNGATARPADKFDLGKLDESMIMEMPFIEAKSFDIAAMLQVAAKDSSIRFRWVNFKNNEGGNYQMFKSIGFTNAAIEDVDQIKTPLGDNIIKDDGSIKYYDVILMKVNVIRLMQAYKANMEKSLRQVGRWSENAKREAERTFNRSVSPDILAQMKQAGLNVEFFVPTKGDMQDSSLNT